MSEVMNSFCGFWADSGSIGY